MTHKADMKMLKKPEQSFYIGWIVLTSSCVPVAFLLSILSLKVITGIVGDYVYVNGVQHITEDYLAMYVFVPLVSLVTGALQYVLLRRYLPRMGWWAAATVAGWLLGILIVALPGWLGWRDTPLTNLDLIFLLMGLAIGITQWLVLRQRLPRAGWWIPANVLGWVMVGLINPGNTLNQFGLFMIGILPACATAAALALFIIRVPSSEARL